MSAYREGSRLPGAWLKLLGGSDRSAILRDRCAGCLYGPIAGIHRFWAECDGSLAGGGMDSQPIHQVKEHHVHQRHFDRLVMLSDGVFAIAMTLSAVELKPTASAGESLIQIWALPLGVYFLSFFLVGGVWARHRRTLAHLHRVDGPVTIATLLLLSLVALLPVFVRQTLTDENGAHVNGMLIYAVSLMAIYLSLCIGWGYAAFIGRLAPGVPKARAWSWLLEDSFVVIIFGALAVYSLHMNVLAVALTLIGITLRAMSIRLEKAAKKLE